MSRTLTTVGVLATLVFTAASCGGDKEPDPIPPAASDSTTPPTTAPTTEPTPSWEDDYSSKQLDAYEAALQRWESYENRAEPIWAEGKATPVAETLFQEYFPSPRWQVYYQRLKEYQQVEVLVEGLPTVFWSRPKWITKNGLNVEIQQCVDYSSIEVTQYGKKVESRSNKPRLRTIQLSKPRGYDWLIYELVDATSRKRPRPCTP